MNEKNNVDINSSLPDWFKKAIRNLGIIISFIGLIVIIGWWVNPKFIFWEPLVLPPMNPLTALEFIFCGIAIYLNQSIKTKKLSFLFSFLIIVIAGFKLLDIFVMRIPIDQILFSQKLDLFTPASRMAPITAINFILSGFSLLFLDLRIGKRKIIQYVATIIIFLSLLLTLGYLFGIKFIPTLREVSPYGFPAFLSPLSPVTAFSFIFIGLSILFMRPREEFMAILTSDTNIGNLTRRLALMAVILPIILGYLANVLIGGQYIDLQSGSVILVVLEIIILEAFLLQSSRRLEDFWKEHIRVEKEIVETKVFDEALLSNMGEAVVAVDKNRLILFMNKTAEEFFEIDASKSIGKNYASLWALSDKDGTVLPTYKRPLEISLNTGKKTFSTIANHYMYITLKRIIPVNITTTPIFLNNKLIGAMAVIRDITVETKVDKYKSEFISLVSHQLMNPLTAISWMIESFLKKYQKKLNLSQYNDIEEIYHINQTIKNLVTDFLNVSRMEIGSPDVILKPINVLATINSILSDDFKVQIANKKMEIINECKDNIVINTDATLFKMIISNIISNAIKYTPDKGRVVIEARLLTQGEKIGNREFNGGCLISVSDNGYGIPKDQQEEIFSKLFRADNIIKRNIEGTGLGLYMVKLFIDRLGGQVWVESEENKGSKFFIYLK